MAEKNLKARIVHKHDTEANWLLATGFTPKQGEIIVYDIDDAHSYERFKIGDGVQNVNDLPFYNDGFVSYNEQTLTNEQKAQARANIDAVANNDMCIIPIENIVDFGGEHTIKITGDENTFYGGPICTRKINLDYSFAGCPSHIFMSKLPDGCAVQQFWLNFKKPDGSTTLCSFISGVSTTEYFIFSVYPKGKNIVIYTLLANSQTVITYDDNGDYVSSFVNSNIDSNNLINKLNSLLSSSSYVPSADADVTTKKYVDDALTLKADQTALDEVSALVGDTAVSEQIDAAIAEIPQVDWSQSDESASDYIKNRTHYEEIINTPNTWTFRLDNSGGWVSGTDPDFVKVISENKHITSVMIDSLEIDLIREREGEVVEDCKYFDLSTEFFDGDGIVSYINHLYIRLFVDENGEYTGKYSIGEDGAGWGACTIVADLQSSIVHHLDPKYIKDMYYETEPVEVILVDNLTSTTEEDWPACTFVVGDTYKVIWNGIEYECVCFDDGEFRVLGTTDNYPFHIDDDEGDSLFIEPANGDEPWTVSVIHVKQNVHQINHKYIKDMYYENTEVIEVNETCNIGGMSCPGNVTLGNLLKSGHDLSNIVITIDGSICTLEFEEPYYKVTGVPESALSSGSCYFQFNSDGGVYLLNSAPDGNVTTTATFTGYYEVTDLKQIDTKYLPILEEAYETIIETEVIDYIVLRGPEYGKLLGKYVVVIDGVSETVEFIDDGIGSFVETDSFSIGTTTSPDGNADNNGFTMGLINPDGNTHSVKVIAIKDVIKEEYLPDSILAKPDWNQNDPNGAGYIENRTHYAETVVMTREIIPQGQTYGKIFDLDFVNLLWEHRETAIYETNYYNRGLVTTSFSHDSSISDTVLEFYLNNDWWVGINKSDGTVTMSCPGIDGYTQGFITAISEEIHQLDEKYIPDTIARVEDIPEQEQSNWNQNDTTSASYIQNRPMYFDVQPIAQNLAASGSTSDYTAITPEFVPVDGTSYYVRGVYTNDKAVTTTFDGVYECQNGKIDILTWDGSGCPILNITTDGINVGISNSYRVASVVIDVIGTVTYHTLDEKYLPDTIARTEDVEALQALVGDTSVSEQINNAIATDDEIIEMLTELDMIPVVTDSDGAILADESNNILLW